MSVVAKDGRILLNGECGVEEAELLLSAVLDAPQAVVVVKAQKVHTALWQILLAVRPRIEDTAGTGFEALHIVPLIRNGPQSSPSLLGDGVTQKKRSKP